MACCSRTITSVRKQLGITHGLERTWRRETQSVESAATIAKRLGRRVAQFPASPGVAVWTRRRRRRRSEFHELQQGLEQRRGADRGRVDWERYLSRGRTGASSHSAFRQVRADYRP